MNGPIFSPETVAAIVTGALTSALAAVVPVLLIILLAGRALLRAYCGPVRSDLARALDFAIGPLLGAFVVIVAVRVAHLLQLV